MLTQSGFSHAQLGDRVEGRWTFALGSFPTTDAIEAALNTMRDGLKQEVLLAEISAAAHELDKEPARLRLTEISSSAGYPPWMRAEAFSALIGDTDDRAQIEAYAAQLSEENHPSLRRLSAVAWDQISGPEATASIRGLLKDEHPTVVETAARRLAHRTQRDDLDAERLLLDRLQEESGPALFVIIRALGTLGSSRALAEMARWSESRTISVRIRETVWRESTNIRAALGMNQAVHGGHLSIPPAAGELSLSGEPEGGAER